MIEETLTADEYDHARDVGIRRFQYARTVGIPDAIEGGSDATPDIVGAVAEAAVAKALGVEWIAHVGNPAAMRYDVGGWQVRGTTRRNRGLIVRAKDRPEDPYLQVEVLGRRCLLVGWAYGGDVKVPEFESPLDPSRPPAWCMPNDRLEPFDVQAAVR